MPANLEDLANYCDARTRRLAFKDYSGAFNGLQLANKGKVTRIGASVDSGVVPFRKAAEAGVDFLIVHHGMYWDMPRPLTGPAYERVATLIGANCALYASHLPLDGHPEIGNNALIAAQLGLKVARPFAVKDGEAIGWIAAQSDDRSTLKQRLLAHYPRLLALEFGSETPREIAICSGSGAGVVGELRPSGVDTLITGDLREETYNYAQENRLNLYLCGHYATEVHGVKALAAELAAKFNLPWEFLPSDNPL